MVKHLPTLLFYSSFKINNNTKMFPTIKRENLVPAGGNLRKLCRMLNNKIKFL